MGYIFILLRIFDYYDKIKVISLIIDFYATAASAYSDSPMCLCVCVRARVCVRVCVRVHVCLLYRLYSELRNSSCKNQLVQFQPNLGSKVVQRISFHAEIWLPWQPKGIIRIDKKNILVNTQKA
jgi:hypothetical protein